jgi:hypothetical protein
MLNCSTAQLNCLFAITVRLTSDVQHCTRFGVREIDQSKQHWHKTQLVKTSKLVLCSLDCASWYSSIVKPTTCTIFRVYWTSLYMFRSFRPSSGVQDCTYSIRHMSYSLVYCLLAGPLASKLYGIYLFLLLLHAPLLGVILHALWYI